MPYAASSIKPIMRTWRWRSLASLGHRAASISFFGACSMKTKLLGLVAGVVLLGSTVAANASPYVVTLEEVGSNVVATGSGSIDLTGLTVAGVGANSAFLRPESGYVYTGAPTLSNGVTQYLGSILGPS